MRIAGSAGPARAVCEVLRSRDQQLGHLELGQWAGTVASATSTRFKPTCQFSKDGTYVFRLTVVAGEETQTDDVTVRLTPYNKAPWVDAGPNRNVRTLDVAVPLSGTVRDDGLPENTPLQIQWRPKYGPGTVTFADAANPTTTATFSLEGIYTLELFASDGQYSATSTVEVRVGALCTIEKIDGLVSWWQANGTAADHGSGNEAFLERGATYESGMVGAAFKFDGVDDRDRVKSPSWILPGRQRFSSQSSSVKPGL